MPRGEREILVAEGGEREGGLSCRGRRETRGKEIVFSEEASERLRCRGGKASERLSRLESLDAEDERRGAGEARARGRR